MAQEDIKKTAFFDAVGVDCFKVMPFGLKNAGDTYHRLVNQMFKEEIDKTMEVYVDDMLVKRKNEEQHIEHLNKSFAILRKYGMKLNTENCTFVVKGGQFLGYMVTERGISVNPEKNQGHPRPSTAKEHQRGATTHRTSPVLELFHLPFCRKYSFVLQNPTERRQFQVDGGMFRGF